MPRARRSRAPASLSTHLLPLSLLQPCCQHALHSPGLRGPAPRRPSPAALHKPASSAPMLALRSDQRCQRARRARAEVDNWSAGLRSAQPFFPPSRAHHGRIGACGGMYRLRLLHVPASAALTRLAREACCFSRQGTSTARSGVSCAVRHVSGGAVDTTDNGAVSSPTVAGPPRDEHAALLHAELSRHGDVRVEVVQQARACACFVEACAADASSRSCCSTSPT